MLGVKRTRQFTRKYMQVVKKSHFAATACVALQHLKLATKLALTCIGWPNGEKLALISMHT